MKGVLLRVVSAIACALLLLTVILLVINTVYVQSRYKQTLQMLSEIKNQIDQSQYRQTLETMAELGDQNSQSPTGHTLQTLSELESEIEQSLATYPLRDQLTRMKWNYFWLAATVLQAIGLSLLILIWNRSNQRAGITQADVKSVYRAGAQDARREMISRLIEHANVLSDMKYWLYSYGRWSSKTDGDRKKVDDLVTEPNSAKLSIEQLLLYTNSAQVVLERLLARLEEHWKLRSFGEIGYKTRVDLAKYQLGDRTLSLGEVCYIVEPGWKLDEEIVVQPVVRRDNDHDAKD